MPFQIIRNDITTMDVDAIVNAANTNLIMGGGVCGAIFNAAGERELQMECDTLSPIKTGEAVITKGYHLLAKYIIHTAGPIWHGGNEGEEELLRNCYFNSLDIAKKFSLHSIAFPLISSGIYGYPLRNAIRVAIVTVSEFLCDIDDYDLNVFLVIYNNEDFLLGKELYENIQDLNGEN